MSDYKVSDTALTAIADAIRSKGGTSASLSFPDGFVSAVQDIPTGGGSTLIEKTITDNGTYDAEDDDADGYSSVTVAVPSAPYITGTFTATTSGVMTITLPYTGSGYPIAVEIYPADGAQDPDSDFYDLIQQYAIALYAAAKCIADTAPDYTSSSGSLTTNQVVAVCRYKSNASDATAYTSAQGAGARVFGTGDPSANRYYPIMFNSATSMKVIIADTSYGFAKDIEYRYHVMYSS